MVAIDLETFLITPETLAPKPVCFSYSLNQDENGLLKFPEAVSYIEHLLGSNQLICGFNIAFDFGVLFTHFPSLRNAIINAYASNRIYDAQIGAYLDCIYDGRLRKHYILDLKGNKVRSNGLNGSISRRLSLENTTFMYLGRSDAKANDQYRLRYAELYNVPFEQWPLEAKQYPIDDAVNTRELSECLWARKQNQDPHAFLHTRAAFAMHMGSIRGISVDKDKVDELEVEAGKALATDLEFLKTAGVFRPDGSKDLAQIRKRLATGIVCKSCVAGLLPKGGKSTKYIKCKLCDGIGKLPGKLDQVTVSGKISTSRHVLEASQDPVLKKLAARGIWSKIHETYLPWLRDGLANNGIRDKCNPVLATGRVSYNGLIQLIPNIARKPLSARPGFVLCSADYAALELCTLAAAARVLVGRSRILETLQATKQPGRLHTNLAAKIAGLPEATPEFIAKAEDKKTHEARLRSMAKAGNFGFGGLMGEETFCRQKRKEGLFFCQLSGRFERCAPLTLEWVRPGSNRPQVLKEPACTQCLDVVVDLKRTWLELWDEMPEYFKIIKSLDRSPQGDFIITSPITGFVRGGLSAAAAANHSFQHLGAIGMKMAVWRVFKETNDDNSPLYGAHFLANIHDEILAEVPETNATSCANRISEIMVESMQELIGRDVPISVEPALMRFWDKKAETRFSEDGELEVWGD